MTCGFRLAAEAACCGRCGARTEEAALWVPSHATQVPPFTPWSASVRHARHSQTADFFTRFVAFVIDSIISGLLPLIPGAAFALLGAALVAAGQGDAGTPVQEADHNDQQGIAAFAGFYLGYVLAWLLYLWVSNVTGGGWGKRIVGIRVISLDTNRAPGAGAALVRTLMSLVSGMLYIGYLWALWDPERRTWHDKASGTTVIYVR